LRKQLAIKTPLQMAESLFALLLRYAATLATLDHQPISDTLYRKRRVLEFRIVHVTSNYLVVLSHALDHEFLDEFADAELKLVERVCQCGLNYLGILRRLLFLVLQIHFIPELHTLRFPIEGQVWQEETAVAV
jgi:hypothetical protein